MGRFQSQPRRETKEGEEEVGVSSQQNFSLILIIELWNNKFYLNSKKDKQKTLKLKIYFLTVSNHFEKATSFLDFIKVIKELLDLSLLKMVFSFLLHLFFKL